MSGWWKGSRDTSEQTQYGHQRTLQSESDALEVVEGLIELTFTFTNNCYTFQSFFNIFLFKIRM